MKKTTRPSIYKTPQVYKVLSPPAWTTSFWERLFHMDIWQMTQKSSFDIFSIVSKQDREYLVAPISLGAACCWSWIQNGRKAVQKRHHQEIEEERQKPPGPGPQFKLSLECGSLPSTVQMVSAFAVTGKDWIQSFFSKFQFLWLICFLCFP